jgi:hypothetical protein
LGDLVISNRISPHREEQDGEVSAFMIGDKCFAWWSNEQLRRLAERRQQEREAQDAEWSRMKGGAVNNAWSRQSVAKSPKPMHRILDKLANARALATTFELALGGIESDIANNDASECRRRNLALA